MKFFYTSEDRLKNNLPQSTRKFRRVAEFARDRMQEELRSCSGHIVYKDYITALDKYLIPFFGSYDVANNLGTGDGFSVRQVIDQAKHVTNLAVPLTHGARRPGDCTKLVSGSLRAKTELCWSAHRSNLKQMITDAWRWHQTGGYIK